MLICPYMGEHRIMLEFKHLCAHQIRSIWPARCSSFSNASSYNALLYNVRRELVDAKCRCKIHHSYSTKRRTLLVGFGIPVSGRNLAYHRKTGTNEKHAHHTASFILEKKDACHIFE
jgi:hypothetical protein